MIEALRRRHPAREEGVAGPGRWVTLREWNSVDLLALDCWSQGECVGFEVKVSRSDMRSELLNPSKRARAVAMTTRFYLAVPAGLLTPEERAYEEPDWVPADFERPWCTNLACSLGRRGRHPSSRYSRKSRGARHRGTDREGVTVDLGHGVERGADVRHRSDGSPYLSTWTRTYEVEACCVVCCGYGTTGRSRVEFEAPTLWVPRDCGLVAVGPTGDTAVLRESPRRKLTEPIIPWPYVDHRHDEKGGVGRVQRQAINQLVRWTSYRPDPRHRR